MEKEFVPYELALRMRQLGFDEPCFGYYDGNHNFNYMLECKPENFSYMKFPLGQPLGWTSAPTFSQAFKWFRKNYRLSVNIHDCLDDFEAIITQWTLSDHKVVHEFPQRVDISYPHNRFDSYEEAEFSCLVKLIEIVKEKL